MSYQSNGSITDGDGDGPDDDDEAFVFCDLIDNINAKYIFVRPFSKVLRYGHNIGEAPKVFYWSSSVSTSKGYTYVSTHSGGSIGREPHGKDELGRIKCVRNMTK